MFSWKVQEADMEAPTEDMAQLTGATMADGSRTDQGSVTQDTLAGHESQNSVTAPTSEQEMGVRPAELPRAAYLTHYGLFCLADNSFVGRRENFSFSETAQGANIDWSSLKIWMRDCEKSHPMCRSSGSDFTAGLASSIRCVDVQTSTIVPVTLQTRYLASSYV